jgi:diphthine synthase
MAFYLIGTGMDANSVGADALKILKTCDKIYLENYTVNFPYPIEELEKQYCIKITELARAAVEDESILKEAKKQNVALLVYGDSLSATTHMQLMLEAKKQGIEYRVFHNASIMTAIAETGLQLYKFGQTASMPNWKEHTNKPTSFMNYVKENKSTKAHTLILTDIGLELPEAIAQLKESSEKEKIKLPKEIIVCSNTGTSKQKIFYDTINNLEKEKIEMPLCLIIPSELHFIEKETLEAIKE